MRYLLPICLCAATLSFALGVSQPLLRLERLIFLSDEPSLVDMVRGLWRDGDVALAMVIALFSLVFPTAKLVLLHIAAYCGPADGPAVPAWFRALSNWSMLDVVLVAIVVFAAKSSSLATALALPGLWFFGASVVLTVAASALLKRRDRVAIASAP